MKRIISYSPPRCANKRFRCSESQDIVIHPTAGNTETKSVLTPTVINLIDSLLGPSLLTEQPQEIDMKPRVILVKMKKVPNEIWKSPPIREELEKLEDIRAVFYRDLHHPTLTADQLRLICGCLASTIGTWTKLLSQPIYKISMNRKIRNAAKLLIKHRTKALTLNKRLHEFAENPTEETLRTLALSLSTLYYLRHMDTFRKR